ncbi:hypothetical protein SAMD00023353_0900990 [Rosellinia necatrix]|uniref:Uncharacterized protein n=1 Tax=Rosellinia necatrix TaxID=77044 RepID=A0A1W2THL1_ROSNE|nr:hypothetical protein SAMD00023353_0900990 [Rosellinia necatrix]
MMPRERWIDQFEIVGSLGALDRNLEWPHHPAFRPENGRRGVSSRTVERSIYTSREERFDHQSSNRSLAHRSSAYPPASLSSPRSSRRYIPGPFLGGENRDRHGDGGHRAALYESGNDERGSIARDASRWGQSHDGRRNETGQNGAYSYRLPSVEEGHNSGPEHHRHNQECRYSPVGGNSYSHGYGDPIRCDDRSRQCQSPCSNGFSLDSDSPGRHGNLINDYGNAGGSFGHGSLDRSYYSDSSCDNYGYHRDDSGDDCNDHDHNDHDYNDYNGYEYNDHDHDDHEYNDYDCYDVDYDSDVDYDFDGDSSSD